MRSAVVALLVLACGRPELSPEADRYLMTAIDSLEAMALTRDSVDWARVRREARDLAGGASSTVETYVGIRHALSRLGDSHSFLQLSDSLLELEARVRRESGLGEPHEAPASPSPFGSRMQPRFELIEEGWGIVGLVFMPQGRRGDDFVRSYQEQLAALAAHQPCGWIVDLRGNGGGDMWPMLAGLGPLLGEGVFGGSVDARGSRSAWIYSRGRAIYRDPAGTEETFAEVASPMPTLDPPRPIAVLHDRGTASSGEALAIAFRGHPVTRSFGERTFGASTSTRGIRLPDGANMVVATAVFTDRDGVAYPDGVVPDEEIASGESIPETDEDPGVARALQWLALSGACADD